MISTRLAIAGLTAIAIAGCGDSGKVTSSCAEATRLARALRSKSVYLTSEVEQGIKLASTKKERLHVLLQAQTESGTSIESIRKEITQASISTSAKRALTTVADQLLEVHRLEVNDIRRALETSSMQIVDDERLTGETVALENYGRNLDKILESECRK